MKGYTDVQFSELLRKNRTYFPRQTADQLAKAIRDQGWDTIERSVNGASKGYRDKGSVKAARGQKDYDPLGLIASTTYADAHPFEELERRKELSPKDMSDTIAALAKAAGLSQSMLTVMLRKLGNQGTLELLQAENPNAHLEVVP